MTKTYGIDVSHWEGTIDWQEASQYVEFCIFKATDVLGFVDPEFAANKAGCIANGVPWGAYHFYQPAFDSVEQADHFVATVGDDCHVYVADVEADTGGDWRPLLKEFLDRVEQLTGKKPMIYTSPGFWNYYVYPAPAWTPQYDLWVAHWGVVEPTLPAGWSTYIIHQFGDDGRIQGIPGACDEDWFNGDLNAVHAYFGLEVQPPGEIRIKVAPGYRRAAPICEQPSNTSKIQGYAVHQSRWTADALVTGADGHTYYRINPSGYIMARLCEEL